MRMARPITLFTTVAAAAACFTGLSVQSAEAIALAPHRAVYDLALDQASDRSGITGLSGRMVYEFNGSACDGYTVTFRFVTRIDTSDSSRVTDQQTTTFEEGDGESFTFLTRSYVDQALDTELRGTARLAGEETVVALEKPERKKMTLGRSQFPTQHLIELLAKAEAGETFYETTIFDGSEDADKVMSTTVIIGRETAPAAADPEATALATLDDEAYRPVDIAYFDLDDGEPTGEELPIYRISFKLHESGVTRDLIMDYGDFSMTGRLVDLAMFDPAEPCTADQ
jgi:hypothetical protein